MTMRVALIAVISSVAFGATAEAQTGSPNQAEPLASKYLDPTAGLALERAIVQALEQEPSLRAARSEVDVALGLRVQAGLRPNPTIAFSQQNEPAGMDNQTRVEVVWPRSWPSGLSSPASPGSFAPITWSLVRAVGRRSGSAPG